MLDGNRIRNLDAEIHKLDVQRVVAEVNERLDCRKRQRRRGIDNDVARSIPAAAGEARPFSTKGGARASGLDDAIGSQQRLAVDAVLDSKQELLDLIAARLGCKQLERYPSPQPDLRSLEPVQRGRFGFQNVDRECNDSRHTK